MMFPSVFGENLFDDWMNDFGFNDNLFSSKNPLYGKHAKNIMKTDVRETDKGYELDVGRSTSSSYPLSVSRTSVFIIFLACLP